MSCSTLRLGGFFDGTRRWPGPVDVACEDGRIAAVTAAGDKRPDIDLSAGFGLPGLVDCHCHLACHRDAVPAERYSLKPDRLLAEARRNARDVLGSGVTTVADCGGRDDVIFRLRDEITSGVTAGPTVYAAGRPVCVQGGHDMGIGEIVRAGERPAAAVERRIAAGADFIKVMLTPGGGERGPHSYFAPAELTEAVATAHAAGLRVTAHVHDPVGVLVAITAGVDGIEHGTFMRDGEVRAAAAERNALAASGIPVCPTNAIDFRKVQAGQPGAPRHALVASWRRTIDAGVTVVGGSDAGVPYMRYDDYALVPELMVAELGLTAVEALRACTAQAARYIRAEGAGRIAPGSRADLLVVENDPTQDISALRVPVALIKSGAWVEPGLLVRTPESHP